MSTAPLLGRVWERAAVWLAGNLLACAAVAWTAVALQEQGFAPAVLFGMLIGGALGWTGAGLWRFTCWPRRRAAIAAAIGWGLLAVAGQDYIGHWRHLRAFDDELERQPGLAAVAFAEAPRLRPTFGEYLAGRFRAQPVAWSLDWLLTAAACAGATALATDPTRPATRQQEL